MTVSKSILKLLIHYRYFFTLLFVALIALGDFYTGAYVTLSAFYLLPLFLFAWFDNRARTQLLVWVIVAAWGAANYYSLPESHGLVVQLWNALVRWCHLTLTAELFIRLSQSYAEKKHLADTDGLTGIANRRAFQTALQRKLDSHATAKPADYQLLAIIDVDFFKAINDEFGHPHGDLQLQRVAHLLAAMSHDGELCGRLGGDEFALYWCSQSAAELHQRIELLSIELQNNIMPCSIGVSMTKDRIDSPIKLYERADIALYQAKQQGRGRAVWLNDHTNTAG